MIKFQFDNNTAGLNSTKYMMTGSNLWDEFELEEVFNFLVNQYSANKLSSQSIIDKQVTDRLLTKLFPFFHIFHSKSCILPRYT